MGEPEAAVFGRSTVSFRFTPFVDLPLSFLGVTLTRSASSEDFAIRLNFASPDGVLSVSDPRVFAFFFFLRSPGESCSLSESCEYWLSEWVETWVSEAGLS